MDDFDLMGKTELSITGILLENANLPMIADAVARVLGLDRSELLVTDVRGDNLVLDILRRGLDAANVVGKERALLDAVSAIDGVSLRGDARIESRGLLSWVSADSETGMEAVRNTTRMAATLRDRLARTAVVFPTGTELNNGQVKDTNSPAIRDRLTAAGYSVSLGSPLRDDEFHISANIRERAEEGYGLIITTGGVGAEVKDRTIEALLLVDEAAETPTIVTYELGVGRHVHKNAVRIGVARVLDSLVIALPGPTDEVLLGLAALVEGLEGGDSTKAGIAARIATVLRARLKEKAVAQDHGHGHDHPSAHA